MCKEGEAKAPSFLKSGSNIFLNQNTYDVVEKVLFWHRMVCRFLASQHRFGAFPATLLRSFVSRFACVVILILIAVILDR